MSLSQSNQFSGFQNYLDFIIENNKGWDFKLLLLNTYDFVAEQ